MNTEERPLMEGHVIVEDTKFCLPVYVIGETDLDEGYDFARKLLFYV
jgi:hypothetical protein